MTRHDEECQVFQGVNFYLHEFMFVQFLCVGVCVGMFVCVNVCAREQLFEKKKKKKKKTETDKIYLLFFPSKSKKKYTFFFSINHFSIQTQCLLKYLRISKIRFDLIFL